MEIWVWNENCIHASKVYVGEDAEELGDVSLWGEGSEEKIAADALSLIDRMVERGLRARDFYTWRCCINVRRFLGYGEEE